MMIFLIVVAVFVIIIWVILSSSEEASSGNDAKEGYTPNKEIRIQEAACMEVRVREVTVDGLAAKQIEVKGPFPFEAYGETVGFIVSVFDCTDDKLHPVLSVLEAFQEPYTIAYDSRVKVGDVSPGTGLHPWAPIGAFIPEIMVGPYGGYRQFVAVVRLVDVHAAVIIRNGSVVEGRHGIFWTGKARFSCSLGENGYVKLEEKRRRLQSAIVRIALPCTLKKYWTMGWHLRC